MLWEAIPDTTLHYDLVGISARHTAEPVAYTLADRSLQRLTHLKINSIFLTTHFSDETIRMIITSIFTKKKEILKSTYSGSVRVILMRLQTKRGVMLSGLPLTAGLFIQQ